MVHKYTLIINGFDCTDMVERDSYSTSLFPVTVPMITTMDGVDHTRIIRYKARLNVCRGCDQLSNGTCMGCGCLVELRAAYKKEKCPYGKWN